MQQQLSRLMENKVIVYGASGHGKVIIDILQKNNVPIHAVIDDNPNCESILGLKVHRPSDLDFSEKYQMILSIGNNEIRKKLSLQLHQIDYTNAFHPKAIISNHAVINPGTVVMAGAIVNAGAVIGKHVIINTSAIVEHDCVISDFVHVSPNASLAGGVQIGEGTQVGLGASVIQNVKIGKWAVIGAGAVVINDVPDFAVMVGIPAKPIKFHANE